MRQFSPEQYITLIEQTQNKYTIANMKDEIAFIGNRAVNPINTIIDLGAGYGRTLNSFAKFANKIICLEINEQMFIELFKRSQMYTNVCAGHSDITRFRQYLNYDALEESLLLLCQNTIGVIEGEWQEVIKEIALFSKEKSCELIISFFRQEMMQAQGISIYDTLAPMVGQLDFQKTDFEKGYFVTKSGYVSKWWRVSEIDSIIQQLNGKILGTMIKNFYHLVHLKLD